MICYKLFWESVEEVPGEERGGDLGVVRLGVLAGTSVDRSRAVPVRPIRPNNRAVFLFESFLRQP